MTVSQLIVNIFRERPDLYLGFFEFSWHLLEFRRVKVQPIGRIIPDELEILERIEYRLLASLEIIRIVLPRTVERDLNFHGAS